MGRAHSSLEQRRRARDVYCYFDNDAKVKAPRDAQRLARLVVSSST